MSKTAIILAAAVLENFSQFSGATEPTAGALYAQSAETIRHLDYWSMGLVPNVPTMVFNKATGRLFFLHNPSGAVADLRSFDPDTGAETRISTVASFPSVTILASGQNDRLYTGYGFQGSATGWILHEFDADPLQFVNTLWVGRTLDTASDLEVSPSDSEIIAFTTTRFGRVQNGTNFYALPQSHSGRIEFSEDGQRLYLATDDCAVEVYNLQGGFDPVLLNTYTNISCADFETANGRLYFGDGTILDVATGQTLATNLSGLNPVLVAVASATLNPGQGSTGPAEILNVLTKTNESWVIHRVNAETFEPLQSVALDSLAGEPQEFVSMGREWAAVRTQNEIVVVPFTDPNSTSLRATRSGNGVTISFLTRSGLRYQLQASTDLRNWETKETIPGTGGELNRTITTGGSGLFYRLQIEPN